VTLYCSTKTDSKDVLAIQSQLERLCACPKAAQTIPEGCQGPGMPTSAHVTCIVP